MSSIHHAAATGFNQQADAYARGRPDYPKSILPWLQETLGLKAGKTVLDLGAGTGKFTGLLQQTGAQVLAVEPVAAMRAKLEALEGISVIDGTAEAIPLPDACLDAVLAATAFHWFATPAAMAEIARLLKPGGWLGLVWNTRDESHDWVAKLTEIMTRYEGDVPRYRNGTWKQVFPAPGFGPLEQTHFPHQHAGPPEQVIIDRCMSVSFIASLPELERNRVTAELRALIAIHTQLAGQLEVVVPYRTEVFWCQRQP
ncbi:class I SAM-dependent methyltransferase [Chitinimonas sp. PSY-7]|uniref:methyltransferase domain-containing protein n=1 Tax=Chitinimonas sp. PSY-7 TaxID=3459088 RepID=UPI00403FC8C9